MNLNLQSSIDLTPRERPTISQGTSEFRAELQKLKESNFLLKFQKEKEGLKNIHSSQ